MDIPKKAKLTNALCRSLPLAEAGQYIVRDAALPGFMAVIGARTRTYTLQIDVTVLGKRKTIKRKIGPCEGWDASAARQETQRLIVEIRERKVSHANRRKALTLQQAWDDYARRFQSKVQAGRASQRTLDGYRDYIERSLDRWLDMPLREIGEAPEMVAERHDELTRVSGPYHANRTMVTLRAVYNAALKNRLDPGIPPYNPVASVAFNHEERRSTGMSPDELKAWAMQLAKLQNPVRREFHLFTLLSAMRPDALKRAKWAHIDRKRRVLHVPKPKGGERRAFDLPLSREMIRSLCRVSRAGQMYGKNGLTWIFPSEAPDGHIAEHKEKRHILSHWGGDLRQTWRTFALRADLGELAASILMNHSLGSVNAGYISTPALRDHLCACQERVSAKIIEAMALPDMANSFKRDIAARLQDAIAPDQAKSIRARQWFFGRDRP